MSNLKLKKLHRRSCEDCIEAGDTYGRTLDNMTLSKEMNSDIQHNLRNHLAIIKLSVHRNKEIPENTREQIEKRIDLIDLYLQGLCLYIEE